MRELRESGAAGRLAPDLRAALRRDPSLHGRIARVLLDRHFPPSPHRELCEAVGLEPEYEFESAGTPPMTPERRRRDHALREQVLTAYEHRCAFCGYDGRIGAVPVGLDPGRPFDFVGACRGRG